MHLDTNIERPMNVWRREMPVEFRIWHTARTDTEWLLSLWIPERETLANRSKWWRETHFTLGPFLIKSPNRSRYGLIWLGSSDFFGSLGIQMNSTPNEEENCNLMKPKKVSRRSWTVLPLADGWHDSQISHVLADASGIGFATDPMRYCRFWRDEERAFPELHRDDDK
jgi:hypothetical protein